MASPWCPLPALPLVSSCSQLAVIGAAQAATVVAADHDETPAEMSDTEKFLWDLQGVSSSGALLLDLLGWSLTICNGDG